MNSPCCLILLLTSASIVAIAGCQKSEQIERYTVAKPVPLEAVASSSADPHAGLAIGEAAKGEPTDRALGAIVPVGTQGWFFKLTGPKDAVAAKADEFKTFLKSVHFSPEGKPAWTLPDGWQEQPGNQIRYATLVIPGEGKPLEVGVTALPKSVDDEAYALMNVNRWRGQLQLPPITREQLAQESTQIQLDGATATLVDLLGIATPGGPGRGPFMSGAPNGK